VKNEPPPCFHERRRRKKVRNEKSRVKSGEWRVERNSVGVSFNIRMASLHTPHSTLHV
jgi:hypothetical protein